MCKCACVCVSGHVPYIVMYCVWGMSWVCVFIVVHIVVHQSFRERNWDIQNEPFIWHIRSGSQHCTLQCVIGCHKYHSVKCHCICARWWAHSLTSERSGEWNRHICLLDSCHHCRRIVAISTMLRRLGPNLPCGHFLCLILRLWVLWLYRYLCMKQKENHLKN
jgi:hypothetical protein